MKTPASWFIALGALSLSATAAWAADAPPDDGRAHVMATCSGCHTLEFSVTPRTRKAWELTVANMRVYAQHSSNPISDADADRAVDYLAAFFSESSNLDPARHFSAAPGVEATAAAEPVQAAAAPAPVPAEEPLRPPAPPPAVLAPLAREDLTPAIRARLERHAARPPRPPALKRAAELGGYAAMACTLALLASGLSRRRLGRRFRPLHVALALGLFLSLATHAIIYLSRFGTPPVLWYAFGLASFLVLVLAQLQGLVRKRFGRVFLRLHVAAGYAGLTLAVLHWIWAWL